MDPDPDLRADAMAALARCARPEDAPAIRRSLAGDPVGEVKVAAIQALARLKDGGSVPLLRALAQGRCEAEVTWEEPGSGWDDWLDVQVTAVEALGAIGAEETVDDLVHARDDEMGQDLDHVVFAALARMPERGVPALRGFFQHGDARVAEWRRAVPHPDAIGLRRRCFERRFDRACLSPLDARRDRRARGYGGAAGGCLVSAGQERGVAQAQAATAARADRGRRS